MFDFDLGSLETDFGSVKNGMIHSRLLETNFGSVENGMIHSRSFLLHYFFMVQQSRDDRDGTDCQTVWQVKFP